MCQGFVRRIRQNGAELEKICCAGIRVLKTLYGFAAFSQIIFAYIVQYILSLTQVHDVSRHNKNLLMKWSVLPDKKGCQAHLQI